MAPKIYDIIPSILQALIPVMSLMLPSLINEVTSNNIVTTINEVVS